MNSSVSLSLSKISDSLLIFIENNDASTTISTKLDVTNPLACKHCSKEFKKKKGLTAHVKSAHKLCSSEVMNSTKGSENNANENSYFDASTLAELVR